VTQLYVALVGEDRINHFQRTVANPVDVHDATPDDLWEQFVRVADGLRERTDANPTE